MLSVVSEALGASAAVRAAADASFSTAVSACARRLAVIAKGAPEVSAASQGSRGRHNVGVIVGDTKRPLDCGSVGLMWRRALCRGPRVEARMG